jgi:hypothetical protein
MYMDRFNLPVTFKKYQVWSSNPSACCKEQELDESVEEKD